MKRNVMISGEFTINELTNANSASQPKPNKKSAQARIEALKAAGVDVSNYFPMGDEMIVRVENGIPSQVLDDDPIFSRIVEGGYIAHSKLYRRWVMAQMFHMLRDIESTGFPCSNFTEALQRRGYEYSWKMVEQEMLAQYKMQKHGDSAAFCERNRWFNSSVVAEMAQDYLEQLRNIVAGTKERHCRRRPYKRIGGTNIFTDELDSKLYAPLEAAINVIKSAKTANVLYNAVIAFNRLRHNLRWQHKQAKAFVDAYKGAGAYFTMKNLILFHGARFNGRPTEQGSILHMATLASELEGWELLGAMKQLIKDSGISIEKKIAEWKK